MSDLDRLRKLAESVEEGAGHLYNLDWRSVQFSDEFGVCPRVHIGAKAGTYIKMGCWSAEEGLIVQRVADYIASLHPVLILELLDRVGNDQR